MSVIIFFILPENGHINGVLKLSKQLKKRGHRVIYIGIEDMKNVVLKQGIEYYTIGDKYIPEGFLNNMYNQICKANIFKQLKILKNYILKVKLVIKDLKDGELTNILLKFKPDLIVVDALLPFAGIVAASTGIKVISVSSTLPIDFDLNYPPLGEYFVPKFNKWFNFNIIRLKWLNRFIKELFWLCLSNLVGLNIWREIKIQAKLWNFQMKKIQFLSSFLPYIMFDEIVLSSKEFDFPFERKRNKYYVGPMVDLERKEEPFNFKKNKSSNYLIYCSFGTQEFRSKRVCKIMQTIINVVSKHPDWELIMVSGRKNDKNNFCNLKNNIHLLKFAPQLKVLDQADLFITHGGFNSIKESILKNVPMLVIPLTRDQPGNASRIEFHKIGLTCLPNKVTEKNIEEKIINILNNQEIKNNLKKMSEIFINDEKKELGVKIIENYIKK